MSRGLERDAAGRGPRPQVICFSTADWDAPLWTNKQHLMDRLARAGVGVLYIDSLGLRTPGAGGDDLRRIGRRLRRWRPFAQRIGPRLWRDSPIIVPKYGSPRWRSVNNRLLRFRMQRNRLRLGLREPIVVWAYNPRAAEVVPSDWPIVYHCVDDLAAFPGIDALAFGSAERAMVRRAQVCIASSRPLVEHLKKRGAREVTYWPNPADVEAYAAVSPRTPPGSRPVMGFVGALQTHKVDVELLAACARMRPGWDFELIGPVGHGLRETADDNAYFAATPSNVHIRPAVPREELPALLARFSVGLIPYKINDYTRSVFPMKLFEYLASGMPIVSTPLPSLVGEVDHVEFASTPETFVAALDRALAAGRDPGSAVTKQRQQYATAHSWTARSHEALQVLRDLGTAPLA